MSYTKGQSKLEFNNILLSNIRTNKNLYISLNYINILKIVFFPQFLSCSSSKNNKDDLKCPSWS